MGVAEAHLIVVVDVVVEFGEDSSGWYFVIVVLKWAGRVVEPRSQEAAELLQVGRQDSRHAADWRLAANVCSERGTRLNCAFVLEVKKEEQFIRHYRARNPTAGVAVIEGAGIER